MLPSLLTALFLVSSSYALSIDTSAHIARHQNIAARHPAAKRSSVSARCIKRNSNSTSSTATSSTAVASTPTTPTAPPASHSSQAASPPASAGTGKVGIAWAYNNDPSLLNFITHKVSTMYSWNPQKPDNTHGLQYAPMLWGPSQVGQFQSLVKPGYANIVLGPNEPDIPGQSNMDPNTAAQLWMANGQPLRAQGYQTITPAVAFSKDWMHKFLAACNNCDFDHMAAHIYATTSQEVIDYLTDLHTTFGMSIWVTEFACQSFIGKGTCTEDSVFTFMNDLIQWMDSTPWIDKYFYYGVMNPQLININPVNALMNMDGTPTKLGRLYIGS